MSSLYRNEKEAKILLGLAFDRAKQALSNMTPEDTLFNFMDEVDRIWSEVYKYNFFKKIIADETELSDIDLNKCVVCGGDFINVLTEEEMIQVQEDKIRYPMMEPVRLCVACCDKLDARMPHKANLN